MPMTMPRYFPPVSEEHLERDGQHGILQNGAGGATGKPRCIQARGSERGPQEGCSERREAVGELLNEGAAGLGLVFSWDGP